MPDHDTSVARGGDDVQAGRAGELGAAAEKVALSIKNVAKMFGLSQLVLRYYELRGLIARRHRIGQTCVYGWADCGRIAFIIKCRRSGLALSEVAPIVVAFDPEDDADVCKRGQEACKNLIGRLEQRRKALDEALAELAHTYSLLSVKALSPHNNKNCD